MTESPLHHDHRLLASEFFPRARERLTFDVPAGLADDGKVIAGSGAIIDYVIRRHGAGRLQPDPSSAAFDDYMQWMHYAEGSAMLPLLLKSNVSRLGAAGAR